MRHSDHITAASPHGEFRENSVAVVDTATEAKCHDLSCEKGHEAIPSAVESEGEEYASAAGCNANNGNAGRTLNANNAVTNGNGNYAGAFAEISRIMGKETLTSRPTRSKNELESRTATGGCGLRDYDLRQLPFWECGKDKAESGAGSATNPDMDDPIWQRLDKANSKRNLKGLSEFYGSMTIAVYAVRRCCKEQDTPKKKEYYRRADVVAAWMIREITRGTYHVRGYKEVDIAPEHPTGKHRMAKVFTLYDRCVQMFVLTIIERKLRRKVLRNNYSNIEGRGIYCNDKTFSMANQIRTAVWKHPGDVVLLTDIRKFYDNVSWKVMCGVVFETVKDKTSRWLITVTLKAAGTLPIGSCLSPLFADILMNDYDEIILRHFKPHFFAAFGDNRMFICEKAKAIRIQQFTKSYYEGRYGVELKGDYQIKPVSVMFSFCKKQFDGRFVRERGEIRRRAISVADKPQSFAGYKGLFDKTDSRHLMYLITHKLKQMKNRQGMEIPSFMGDKVQFDEFLDKRICVTNYRRVENHKESGYYYIFQVIDKRADGSCRICRTQNGSFEIKQAGDLWMREGRKPPIYVTVRKAGKSFYFEEFHTTSQEACESLMQAMNIQL